MKHIIISTTSLNRPELHNDNMLEWINWLNDLDRKIYKIMWFINIDIIDKLSQTFEETKQNYLKLSNNKFTMEFLQNPTGKGNFLHACQRLNLRIVEYIGQLKLSDDEESDIKIVWLEDDWKLNKGTKININEIIDNYSTKKSHINLSFIRNNYIWALAPSIISYSLYKDLYYPGWLRQKDIIDPEHCIGLYFKEKYGAPDNLLNLTVINKTIKNDFLTQNFLKLVNSYYTYHDSKFNILENEKYINKMSVKSAIDDNVIFIRITASFCIDGCNYGRIFMEKNKLYKAHKQDNNNTNFYN